MCILLYVYMYVTSNICLRVKHFLCLPPIHSFDLTTLTHQVIIKLTPCNLIYREPVSNRVHECDKEEEEKLIMSIVELPILARDRRSLIPFICIVLYTTDVARPITSDCY